MATESTVYRQMWNTDVVWYIAAELNHQGLTNAAPSRVCKQWLPVIQSHLYRRIVVDSSLQLTAQGLTTLLFIREDLR